MKTFRAIALKPFSLFVDGHGIVHGDPDNSDDAAKHPLVPESAWLRLVDEGCIADEVAPAAAPPSPPSSKSRKSKANGAPPPPPSGGAADGGAPIA